MFVANLSAVSAAEVNTHIYGRKFGSTIHVRGTVNACRTPVIFEVKFDESNCPRSTQVAIEIPREMLRFEPLVVSTHIRENLIAFATRAITGL